MSGPVPESVEAGVLEGGLWGVKVRWPGGVFVDGMLAETARRLADRVGSDGHPDLAQELRQAAREADRNNLASEPPDHSSLHGLSTAPLAQRRPGGPMSGTAADPESASDVFNALERLGELHRKGVLTDEEFAAKKAELLARI
jgi:hypothetical protein